MNDHVKLRAFLTQLRKFLPEKTIYETLSSLPEDIFDDDDYICIPYLSSDEDVQRFISDNGFEKSENIINFFMEQYMNHFYELLDNIFEELDITDENIVHCVDYTCLKAE